MVLTYLLLNKVQKVTGFKVIVLGNQENLQADVCKTFTAYLVTRAVRASAITYQHKYFKSNACHLKCIRWNFRHY